MGRRRTRAALAGALIATLALAGPASSEPDPATAVAAATSSGAAPAAPARSAPTVAASRRRAATGFSPGFDILYADPARLRRDLAGMRRAGARQVRIDISWATVQSSRGPYDWSDTDRVLRAARAARLRVLAVIGYEPTWARSYDESGSPRPVDPEAFAGFAAAAAHRYSRQVAAWEIWNEPNTRRFWRAAPDPAAYARLVEATTPRLRAHDPGAPVVVGSMAPAVDAGDGSEISPRTFLSGFYARVAHLRLFDAVSVHPYSYPAMPDGKEDWNTFHGLSSLNAVMRRAGDGHTPLWLTEYGAPTGRHARSVSQQRQAQMMVRAQRRATRLPYVGPIFFYSYRDSSARVRDLESNFGVVRHNGRPKRAFWTLRRELRRKG